MRRVERDAGSQRRVQIAAAGAACAVLLVAACGGAEDASSEPTSPSGGPSASAAETSSAAKPEDPDAGAKAAALKAYGSYWKEKQAAYAKADAQGTRLPEYAVAEAWASAEREIASLAKRDFVAQGVPRHDPSVTKVDVTGKVWAATLKDCLDISGWTLVDRRTQQPVDLPDERRTRYVSSISMERWDGRWVVVKTTQENRSC
ncbi:hypothetical protein ACWD01_33465 [Streptomyces sp. NPDC002835]